MVSFAATLPDIFIMLNIMFLSSVVKPMSEDHEATFLGTPSDRRSAVNCYAVPNASYRKHVIIGPTLLPA